MPDSVQPHRKQPTSLSCPWDFPGKNSGVGCRFLLQSFPASRSFPMSWLFVSGDQSIGASASATVLPVSIQGWFLWGLTGFISLQSKGLSRVFSITTVWKHQFFSVQPSLWYNFHMATGKTIALTIWTFVFCGCSHCLQWFWSPRK